MKNAVTARLCALVLFAVSQVDAQVAAPRSDTIVKLASTPRYPGVATLVDEVTIGVNESSPNYDFNLVADALAAKNGNVWIIDSPGRNPKIRIFDASGKFIRSVGRLGDGPGEFRAPAAVAELTGGRVGVRDLLAHKINVYTASGEVADSWKFPTRISGVLFGGDAFVADSLGNWYVYLNSFEGPDPAAEPAPFADGGAMVRFSADRTRIDTIARANLPRIQSFTLTTAGIPAKTFTVYHDLTPRPSWHFSPKGYMVTGVPSRYALELRIPPRIGSAGGAAGATPMWRPGDPVVSIRRNVPVVYLSEAERADRNGVVANAVGHDHGAMVGAIPSVPPVKPAYYSFSIDRDGRIWVRTAQPSERYSPPPAFFQDGIPKVALPWREPTTYDVFESDGGFVGTVRVPYGTNLLFGAVRGNTAWVLYHDADDVERIKRTRVAWQQRPVDTMWFAPRLF